MGKHIRHTQVEFYTIEHAKRKFFTKGFAFYTLKGIETQVSKFLKDNSNVKLTHRHCLGHWNRKDIERLVEENNE